MAELGRRRQATTTLANALLRLVIYVLVLIGCNVAVAAASTQPRESAPASKETSVFGAITCDVDDFNHDQGELRELPIDRDPNLHWLWTIRTEKSLSTQNHEVRLYQGPLGYVLVAAQLDRTPIFDRELGLVSYGSLAITHFHVRALAPELATSLSKGIAQAIARQNERDRVERLYRMGFDGYTVVAGIPGRCARFGEHDDQARADAWLGIAAALRDAVLWRHGFWGHLRALDAWNELRSSDELPELVADELASHFVYYGTMLVLLLFAPALVALGLIAFPNRPKYKALFVWQCFAYTYGVLAIPAVVGFPFRYFYAWNQLQYGHDAMGVVVDIGEWIYVVTFLAWPVLAILIPMLMRWRRWPRGQFAPVVAPPTSTPADAQGQNPDRN